MGKRRRPQEKASIVVEFFLYYQHIRRRAVPQAQRVACHLPRLEDKFLQGGKQVLAAEGPTKNHAKEVENLKCIGIDIVIRLFFNRLSVRILP